MKIKLNNWSKYQQRTSGYKNCWWFSMSNKFLEDPEMWELSDAEKLSYIYLLSQASKANTDTITVSVRHAEKSSDINGKALMSAIKKLEGFGIVAMICTDPVQKPSKPRPVHNITEQDITEQNTTNMVSETPEDVPDLIALWNEHSGSLPKVKSSNPTRKKKMKQHINSMLCSEWIIAIKNVASSDFCNARTGGSWRASFDWFLGKDKNGALNFFKAFEGNYDNKTSFSGNDHLFTEESNDSQPIFSSPERKLEPEGQPSQVKDVVPNSQGEAGR